MFVYAMFIYIFMFTVATESKFVFTKKIKISLLNLIHNVSLHITNNIFFLIIWHYSGCFM